ncbi:glycosyltransferase [Treponema berlinense]|uniref:glycosyltransferase n=1 Tax=Treponema berlinense TaxID=225004 RepID=UPI003FD7FFFF
MFRVAIVHDWLVNYGGAERVVEAFLKIYPDADIFTLVYDDKKMGKIFPKGKVHTSFVQKIPLASKLYTKMLPLMPKAFENFDFSSYDLVLCSSSSCAKGVITPPSVPHLAYIHTPMRYAWDQFFEYQKRSKKIVAFFMNKFMPSIRLWDFVSSQRIDSLIANSKYIQRRIKKYWNLDSKVIYPPVDTERLCPNALEPEDFYVVFSRFVPYKRIDLAISACGELGRKLVVIGGGSQEKELKALAAKYKGADIKFTGRISDSEVQDYLMRCRAMIFSAEEDFGIIPVEVQACGRPVIAFAKGGSLETVIDKKTGVFFKEQKTESVMQAIKEFETLEKQKCFNPTEISSHAKSFSTERFCAQIKDEIEQTLKKF